MRARRVRSFAGLLLATRAPINPLYIMVVGFALPTTQSALCADLCVRAAFRARPRIDPRCSPGVRVSVRVYVPCQAFPRTVVPVVRCAVFFCGTQPVVRSGRPGNLLVELSCPTNQLLARISRAALLSSSTM